MRIHRREFVLIASVAATGMLEGCHTMTATEKMSPANSADGFKDFVHSRGLSFAALSMPDMVDAALAFYGNVRASGLEGGHKSDMLLFQWGVFNWGRGEFFELDLTRQFIVADEVDDDAISQLSCTAYFLPTPTLRSMPRSNRWCESPAEVGAFADFIHSSDAYRAVSALSPVRIEVDWNPV
jgi:hypothetical protein